MSLINEVESSWTQGWTQGWTGEHHWVEPGEPSKVRMICFKSGIALGRFCDVYSVLEDSYVEIRGSVMEAGTNEKSRMVKNADPLMIKKK